jgi:hypothetical protein
MRRWASILSFFLVLTGAAVACGVAGSDGEGPPDPPPPPPALSNDDEGKGSFGTSNFPCPVTEDFDRHQEEVPNSGGLAENTDWYPATVHSC